MSQPQDYCKAFPSWLTHADPAQVAGLPEGTPFKVQPLETWTIICARKQADLDGTLRYNGLTGTNKDDLIADRKVWLVLKAEK